MEASSIPPKFPIPWAYSAGGAYISSVPTASQIGIQNGVPSLTDGFPPLNFLPTASGGVPPFGQYTNGILKQITQWSQWQQAGAPVVYDGTFSTDIGGYPEGALLFAASRNNFWLSTADNNTNDPDTSGTDWIAFPNTIIGNASISGVTFFGSSGTFNINPNEGGNQLLNFAASQYLQYTPGTGFDLVTTGLFGITAPGGVVVSAALSAVGPVSCAQGTTAGEAVRLDQFPASLTATGYKKYPDLGSPTGYYIEQWGIIATSNDVAVTFGIAFPNAVFNIIVTEAAASSGTWGSGNPTVHSGNPLSLTQFTHWTLSWNGTSWGNGTNGCYWRAIGY